MDANIAMNRIWIVLTPLVVRVLAATASVFILLAPCSPKSWGDPGPGAPGPAEAAPPSTAAGSASKPAAHKPPAPPQAQPGMQLVRKVMSPSGKLIVQYM